MGRGDNRTKRGKISNGTFGVSRPAKVAKKTVTATAEEKPVKKAAKKS